MKIIFLLILMFLSTQLFSKSLEGKRLNCIVKDFENKKENFNKLDYCIGLKKKVIYK